jgi:hypothetical protein
VDHNLITGRISKLFANLQILPLKKKPDEFTLPTTEDFETENARLRVFKHLAEGSTLPRTRGAAKVKLPHINNAYDGFEVTGMPSIQSRRCWKSLLLRQSALNEHNEWGIVSEHFQNSRSRKVLSILQSQ